FNLPHAPKYLDRNYSVSGNWNHSLSDRTFYEIKGNFFSTERIRGDGVYFDNLAEYSRPNGDPTFSSKEALFCDGDDPAPGVNAGLRWDYLTPSTRALRSEAFPLGPEFGDSLNDPSALGPQDLTDSKVYQRLSPRLGVGFPVTDQTLVHVNYGKFYQQPNLQD